MLGMFVYFILNWLCIFDSKRKTITGFLWNTTKQNCIFFQIYEEGNDLYSAHRPQTCNLKNQHFMHLTEIETLLDLEIYTTWWDHVGINRQYTGLV